MLHCAPLRFALLLVIIIQVSACKKDKSTEISLTGGYRQVNVSGNTEPAPYYIFNNNNTFTILSQSSIGGRDVNTHNYRVDGNMVYLSIFSTRLYVIRTAGDTLKLLADLSQPESNGNNIILVKDNNSPAPETWVSPITISGRVYRNSINLTGMAWSGGEIWTTFYGENTIRKFNAATGEESAPITTTAGYYGIDMAGGSLWAADYNTGNLKKLNPATGAVIFSAPAPPTDFDNLAADAFNVYGVNVNSSRLTIYNISANTYSTPIDIEDGVRDLTYKNGHLYLLAYNTIYKFEIASLSIVKTYRFNEVAGCTGLTTDGDAFYARVSDGIYAPGYFAKFYLN